MIHTPPHLHLAGGDLLRRQRLRVETDPYIREKQIALFFFSEKAKIIIIHYGKSLDYLMHKGATHFYCYHISIQ